MVLETVLLLLPCALSNTAQISDTVFFTWYVHLCLPKPLETLLKFAFHPFFFKIFKPKGLLTWTFPSSFLLSFFSFHMLAHFLILPSLQGFLMYQLQLTSSQVGLQDISEHRGAAGSLSASSLTPRPKLWFMGSTDVLSQAGRETPGQTTETLPAADCLMLTTERNQAKGGGAHQELPHHHTHIFIFNCSAKQFYLISDRNISEMFIPDLIKLVLTCKNALNQKWSHMQRCTSISLNLFGEDLRFYKRFYRITFLFLFYFNTVYKKVYSFPLHGIT